MSVGPTGVQNTPAEPSSSPATQAKGSFNGRKVHKQPPQILLKNLLHHVCCPQKSLKSREVFPFSEPPSQPLAKEQKAKSVLPDFIPDKVKSAPNLNETKKVRRLGKGSYGTVDLVTNRSKQQVQATPTQLQKQYVVKTQKLKGKDAEKTEQLESAKKEVNLQKQAPGAPQINQEQVKSNRHQIMMEYGGSPLSALMLNEEGNGLEALPETLARDLSRQLLGALSETHDTGIIHRDIKPDNVLIDHKGVIRLVDFGASDQAANGTRPQDAQFEEVIGSPAYMAPEVIKGQPYSIKADVYSAGIMLAEIMTGVKADFVKVQEVNGNITIVHLPTPMKKYLGMISSHPGLSPQAKDLLLKMLERSPEKRLSSAEAAAHPYFTEIHGLNDLSYAELRTLHETTYLQLAMAEEQLERAETTKEAEFLQDKIGILGAKVKALQERLTAKEYDHTPKRPMPQPPSETKEVSLYPLPDELDQIIPSESGEFDASATMVIHDDDAEFIGDIEGTMVINNDLPDDPFEDLGSTMVVKEEPTLPNPKKKK